MSLPDSRRPADAAAGGPLPQPAASDVSILIANPTQIARLMPDEARALLPQLAALVLAVTVRAAAAPAPTHAAGEQVSYDQRETAIWLNTAQVGERFGLTESWLREHARELERVPNLVARPSHKVRLYRAAALRRWVEARAVA